MSHQLNILIGRLGADPEMRYTPSGQAVTNFPVATNRKYNNANGEEVKETCGFKISAWGKLGEVCNTYLHKGSQVYIEGRLVPDPATGNPRIWNRQDGSPAASYEIHADVVRFLDSKNGNGNGNGEQPAPAGEEPEIPF